MRALARLSLLSSGRKRVVEAAIAVTDDASPAQARGRAVLARALALHMFAAGGGSIAFSARAGAAPGLRHELLGLADVLLDETGGTTVTIAVRFGASPAEVETAPAESAPV